MFTHIKNLCETILKMGVPGFDLIVYQHGQCIFRHMGGYADLERKLPMTGKERCHIYSCSKPITCTAALLLGGLYLMARRVITWQNPTFFIATVFVFSLFMEGFDPIRALSMVMCGGVVIGAIFMATDYTTSPPTPWGKVIFGIGCGLLTCLIRYFGNLPEGVSYAIIIGNMLTPLIEKITIPTAFGREGKR